MKIPSHEMHDLGNQSGCSGFLRPSIMQSRSGFKFSYSLLTVSSAIVPVTVKFNTSPPKCQITPFGSQVRSNPASPVKHGA